MCDLLLADAYSCRSCPEAYGFSSPTIGGPYFKFPPIIGCRTKPKLLFVGINPRITLNRGLHEQVMASYECFAELSENKVNGLPYVINGGEPHYRFHTRIVSELFGDATPFEEFAAASELYLCATADTENLPELPLAPCALKFLLPIIAVVKPEIIVAVGGTVFRYFRDLPHSRRASGSRMLLHSLIHGQAFRVVGIPHPANEDITEEMKATLVGMAIKLLTALLRDA